MAGSVIWRIRDCDLHGYDDWRKVRKEDYEESLHAMVYKEVVT